LIHTLLLKFGLVFKVAACGLNVNDVPKCHNSSTFACGTSASGAAYNTRPWRAAF